MATQSEILSMRRAVEQTLRSTLAHVRTMPVDRQTPDQTAEALSAELVSLTAQLDVVARGLKAAR